MSKLSIGLVTSPNEESKQLVELLLASGIEVTYNIAPNAIESQHIENSAVNAWLLNVDDDHWDDKIDELLDESEASIYFNEPGTLAKQAHPKFWCSKLVDRLYELTGLSQSDDLDANSDTNSKTPTTDAAEKQPASADVQKPNSPEESVQETTQDRSETIADEHQTEQSTTEAQTWTIEPETNDSQNDQLGDAIADDESLNSALQELEINSIGLPSDIAAELVSELEEISPDLDSAIEDAVALDSKIESTALSDAGLDAGLDAASDEAEDTSDEAGNVADAETVDEEVIELEDFGEFSLDENIDSNDEIELSESDNGVDLSEDIDVSLDETAELDVDLVDGIDEIELEDIDVADAPQETQQEIDLGFDSELSTETIDFDVPEEPPLESDLSSVQETEEIGNEILELAKANEATESLEPLEPSGSLESSESLESLESLESNAIDEFSSLSSDASLENQDSDQTLDSSAFEEIDFSSSSIPVLESMRDDDQQVLQSVYDVTEENESESESDSDSMKNNDQPIRDELSEAIEPEVELPDLELDIGLDLGEQESSEIELLEPDLDGDSLTLESIDAEVDERSSEEFNLSDSAEEQVDSSFSLDMDSDSPETELEASGLSLESMEPSDDSQQDSIQLDEQNQLFDSEEVTSTDELSEQSLLGSEGGLQLESIDEPKVSGKAVFIEEEESHVSASQQEPEPQQPSEQLESGGLTLESIGDEPTSGKAQYKIDGEVLEETLPPIEKESLTVEPEITEPEVSETEATGTEVIEPEAIGLEENNDFSLDLSDSEDSLITEEEPLLEEELTIDDNLSLDEFSLDEESELDDLEAASSESYDIVEPSNDSEPAIETGESIELMQPVEPEEPEQLSEPQKSAATVPDPQVEVHPDLEASSEEEELFDIPMLDDAATGVDFNAETPKTSQTTLGNCWVIGASLGGPAAVKRFLQSLPADINASFVIAQHIDENFLPVLADILTGSSHFDVVVANGSNDMCPGKIYLAPLKGKLIFLQDGSMLVDRSQKWSEPYSPCIDDVIESMSSVYKEKCGAIIFSGMGQDGLTGSRKMLDSGGAVWAQSVDTCANSSMPEAVINANIASVIAAPEVLAERLSRLIKSQ